MNLEVARPVFDALERKHFNDDGRWNEALEDPDDDWNPPTYDVRLDAGTDRQSDERDFRIRVVPGASTGGIDAAEWRLVVDLAEQYDLNVDVQNAGIELR